MTSNQSMFAHVFDLSQPWPDASWPDTGRMRWFLSETTLRAEQAQSIVKGLELLGAQFIREGRCARWQVTVGWSGHGLVLLWDGPLLSGCSHDKIHGLILHHEERFPGLRMLSAPPILLLDPPWIGDRAGLQQAWRTGHVNGNRPIVHTTIDTIGQWRQHGVTRLAEHPLGKRLGIV